MKKTSLLITLSLLITTSGLAATVMPIEVMMAKNTQQSDSDFTAYINNQTRITHKAIVQYPPFSISLNVMIPVTAENPYPYTKLYVADIKSISADEVKISMPDTDQRAKKLCLNISQKNKPDILIKQDSSEIVHNALAITIQNCPK